MTSQDKQVTVQQNESEKTQPKGLLRIPGIIAFILIIGIVGCGTYLFAGSIIKSVIESTGTSINGAKVEVEAVSLGLFPASLTLNKMAVADPDKPMQNIVEFDTAKASINLTKLLMGQVIIPDLTMDGLKFETTRQRSGAIDKTESNNISKEPSKSAKESLAELSQELPSADEILAREPLLVDQRKTELEKAYKDQKAIWDSTRQSLPDSEKLKSYEARAKEITQTKIKSFEDFESAKEKLEQLKADIKTDKAAIKEAQERLLESKKILQTHITNLKNAPKEDWNRIKEKYSFDQDGLSNLSGLLFGEQIEAYTRKALYWYEKIKPYLDDVSTGADATEEKIQQAEKEIGHFVRFPEEQPLPDFLIEQANISTNLPQGDLQLELKDITHQQHILGRPTRLKASSTALQDIKAFNLAGVLDYRKDVSQSTFDFSLEDAGLSAVSLGSNAGAEFELQSAMTSLKGTLALIDHKDVKGAVTTQFSRANFAGTASNRLTEELLAALQTIKNFQVEADVSGSVDKPAVSISSDIDRQFKKAFANRLDEKTKDLRNKINQKLNDKLASYLPESEKMAFTGAESLSDYSDKLEDLLKTKLDDFAKQQTEKAKDKAAEKLKEKFKGLF